MAFLYVAFAATALGAPASTTAPVAVTCYRGAWSSTASYAPGQVVTYNGANYVSLVQNTNMSPLSSFADWSILDASAAKGPNCAKGSVKPTTGPNSGTPPPAPNVPAVPPAATTPPKPAAPASPVRPAVPAAAPDAPASPESQSPPATANAASPAACAPPPKTETAIKFVSIYDSPAVPDVGGHSIIGGLLTGKGLTAILPNLAVCMTPKDANRARRVCTEICKPGHQCLNQPFSNSGMAMGANQTYKVEVLDVDRPGSIHNLATFDLSPATCMSNAGAGTSAECKFPAINKQEPNLSGIVQIGFGTAVVQCLAPNTPLNGTWRASPGEHFVFPTSNVEAWTHVCQGSEVDAILFKVFGGQAPPSNPQITGQCGATTSHLMQFINAKVTCLDGSAACLDSLPVCPISKRSGYISTSGGERVCREYGDTWYSDHGVRADPNLNPEELCDGKDCHVDKYACPNSKAEARWVLDNPDVQVKEVPLRGYAMKKSFVDFVMCGSQVTGVIRWARTGVSGAQVNHDTRVYRVEQGLPTDPTQLRGLKNEVCAGADLNDVQAASPSHWQEVMAVRAFMNCAASR